MFDVYELMVVAIVINIPLTPCPNQKFLGFASLCLMPPFFPRKPPPNGALNVRQLLSLQCPQGNGLQGQEKGLRGQLSPQWAPKKGPAWPGIPLKTPRYV